MPMIDVYAPNDLLPAGSDRRIGEALTLAVLRAEGVSASGPRGGFPLSKPENADFSDLF